MNSTMLTACSWQISRFCFGMRACVAYREHATGSKTSRIARQALLGRLCRPPNRMYESVMRLPRMSTTGCSSREAGSPATKSAWALPAFSPAPSSFKSSTG